jgi:hypothetical protein
MTWHHCAALTFCDRFPAFVLCSCIVVAIAGKRTYESGRSYTLGRQKARTQQLRLSPPSSIKAAMLVDRFLVGYYGYYGNVKGGPNPDIWSLVFYFRAYIEIVLPYIFRVCFHFRYIDGIDIFGRIVFAYCPYERSIRLCYFTFYAYAKQLVLTLLL